MRTVDKLTNQDVVSQLLTVDHATEATTVNKIPQANLSEKLKETKPTSSNRDNSSPQALQDHYHSNDVPKLNDVHGGTHRDFSNIPSAERQALQDLYESTDGPHWNYGSSSSAGTHWSFDDPDFSKSYFRSVLYYNLYYSLCFLSYQFHIVLNSPYLTSY